MDEVTTQKQDEIIDMVSSFCEDYLNDEYTYLSVKLVKEIGKRDDNPFKRGKLEIWASGVIYAIAQLNSLFNKSSQYHICADDICFYFGTNKSTVSKKAASIASMFDQVVFQNEFSQGSSYLIEDDDEMDDFFVKCFDLFYSGNDDDAIAMLDTIDEDSPHYGRALFYKSVITSKDKGDPIKLFVDALLHEIGSVGGVDIDEVLDEEEYMNLIEDLRDVDNSLDNFHEGLEYYEKEDFETALKYFDLAIESNPKDSEAIYYKSLALSRLGDFDIALDMVNRAISLDDTQDRYWNDKGNYLSRLDDFDGAQKCFDKAIEINPRDSVLWANKGFLYIQTEQYDEAIKSYIKALDLEYNIHNLVGLANVYIDLADFPNAERYLDKACEIDDHDLEYLCAMAHFRTTEDRLDEALEYWDKVLEIDSQRADVWVFKSMIYLMLNNEFKASECVEKAFNIDPHIDEVFEDFIMNDPY